MLDHDWLRTIRICHRNSGNEWSSIAKFVDPDRRGIDVRYSKRDLVPIHGISGIAVGYLVANMMIPFAQWRMAWRLTRIDCSVFAFSRKKYATGFSGTLS